jgi:hypothetical protein
MNRLSLTAHPAGLAFAILIYIIDPPWNAGTVPVCMMLAANLAALAFGGVRKSTGRHSAGVYADTSRLDELKWKLGWKLPSPWLWPGQQQAPEFLVPAAPMTAVDYLAFGTAGGGMLLAAGMVALMFLILLG